MKIRTSLWTVALGCMLTSLVGCDTRGNDTPNPEHREVVFEADQIAATIHANPDAVLFIDLREPVTYTFDQPDAPIELTNFVVQCPSMASPIPMHDFLDLLDLDSELAGSWWSIGSAEDTSFRGPFHQDPDGGGEGGGCSLVCPGGVDCALVCEP